MNKSNFLYSFRGRLLLVLAFLLVVTLGVQYYLNLRAEDENARRRERRGKALVAGLTLGFNDLPAKERLIQTIRSANQAFPAERIELITDILVIDNEWQIYDSLNRDYLPRRDADGETKYIGLQDLKDLPPLLDADILGADRARFPNANYDAPDTNSGEAHAVPVETAEDGRWYVMVILKSDKAAMFQNAAQPLVYTLGVLLISTLVTIFLVWRFTRPIAELSEAAREVAEGDLTVRVGDDKRRDEMGELAARFNEMVSKLERSRDLKAKLQEAEKSAVVGRLASAIAHEIRNPLNYINLTLDHLRAKFKPAETEKQETFERLTAQLKIEVERINNQISGFLNYSRPRKLDLQPASVRAIVEDSLKLIEPQASERNVVMSIVERDQTAPILGDENILRSVFSNLFLNAVQAMRDSEGGRITATIAACGGDFVSVEIADNGSGISAEDLSKIFEPYFSTKETGTGLGLAIVKKIVDDHNGEIAVESTVEVGTIFTVKLPKSYE